MLNTLGIVEPRRMAQGAAGHFGRKLGGKSLLEWVVRQATECARLDRVVVVTGPRTDARVVAELVPPDVTVLSGNAPDLLGRYLEALDEFPARGVVRVFADNPCTDPVLLDRLVTAADEHSGCDYISYRLRDGRPALMSPVGVFGEWCRAESLRRAAREATRPTDREQVTRYMLSHPEKYTVRLLAAPRELDRDDLRLTVDCEEDWEHAETIFEALGSEALDWRQVAGLLEQNPALRRRMAVLNQSGLCGN